MVSSLLRLPMSVTRQLIVIMVSTAIVVSLLSLLPWAPSFIKYNDTAVNPRSLQLFRGFLQENDVLSQAVMLHQNVIHGPETLQPREGE